MNGFLPEPLLSRVRTLADRFDHLDTATLPASDFHRHLNEQNPEILLTCWKTPPLPAKLPPRLRYACHLAGSVKKIVARAHLENGLIVTNWGGSISRTVAECALFHLLSGLRRATFWTLAMHREGSWREEDAKTASLFGRRVGIHGFGRVARELIALLRPFGCRVSVFAPDTDSGTEAGFGIKCAASLDDLFRENEIIVELAPLIPATNGIVTERLLHLIPSGGVFVNVGRGAVVDEAALLRVAREGKIAVGLDVFTIEPLPADSGFRGLSNVTLTPHIAGPTSDRYRDAGEFAVENLNAYARGGPMKATLSVQTYDSST